MSNVVLQPAVRQLKMLHAGEISVLELAEAHIAQIERLNKSGELGKLQEKWFGKKMDTPTSGYLPAGAL